MPSQCPQPVQGQRVPAQNIQARSRVPPTVGERLPGGLERAAGAPLSSPPATLPIIQTPEQPSSVCPADRRLAGCLSEMPDSSPYASAALLVCQGCRDKVPQLVA